MNPTNPSCYGATERGPRAMFVGVSHGAVRHPKTDSKPERLEPRKFNLSKLVLRPASRTR